MRNSFLILVLILNIPQFGFGQLNPTNVDLETLPSRDTQIKSATSNTITPAIPQTSNGKSGRRIPAAQKDHATSSPTQNGGNLPAYARRTESVEQIRSPSMTPKNADFDSLVGLKRGDVLRAVIQKNLAAYPGSKAPITARVIEGKFKGAFLYGQATLDQTTKRANIEFSSIRPLRSSEAYSFTGELTSADGIMGLEGEYETSYWTYLFAEAATNMVAGFARGSTPYSQTQLGNYTQEPGIKAQATNAVAEGLASTAERIGNRTKNAPEITTVQGPVIVDIIVTK